jgi:hypothetical protein
VIAPSAIELADRQMAESATLAAFTGGVAYEIKKQGYWSNSDSSVQLGLVREITFAKPITTRMQQWPVIVWPAGSNGYQQYAYNAQYKNVTSAILNLDKDKGLVAIVPGEGAVTVQGPGNDWINKR